MYISIILTTIILRAQNALDVRASWILDTCRATVDFDVLPPVGRRVTGNHGDGCDGWMDG